MRTFISLFCLSVLMISCGNETSKNTTVTGNIKGLKKGILYLQQLQDSTLVNVDSLEIRGEGTFELSAYLEHPQLMYVYLDRADQNDFNDRKAIFLEPGIITFNSYLNEFDTKAKISGSVSHTLYEEYQNTLSRFNMRDLELAQMSFNEPNADLKDSLENLAQRNFIGRFRYLLNFGLAHPDSYVTPYVLVQDGEGANPKYLDSIYNKLDKKIANSPYGKKLQKMIQ